MSGTTPFPRGPLYDENVELRLVNELDAALIVELRNTPKGKILSRGATTVADQVAWIKEYQERERQGSERYFAIVLAGETVGFVRMYDIEPKAGIFTYGSLVIRQDTPTHVAPRVVRMIYDFAFERCGLRLALVDVRLTNSNVRRFQVHLGARELRRTDLDIFYDYSRETYRVFRPRLSAIIGSMLKSP
jgi:hypothetical protein